MLRKTPLCLSSATTTGMPWASRKNLARSCEWLWEHTLRQTATGLTFWKSMRTNRPLSPSFKFQLFFLRQKSCGERTMQM